MPTADTDRTVAPSTPTESSAAEDGDVGGGGDGRDSSLIVLAIVCGAVVSAGVGMALLCCSYKKRKEKYNRTRNQLAVGGGWGDSSKVGEGGGGGDAPSEQQREGMELRPVSALSSTSISRAASIALIAAPFEGGPAWHEAEDGQGLGDVELGLGRGLTRMSSGSTIGPRVANPLYEARMNRAAALGRLTGTGAAATASPSAAGDDLEDVEEEGEGGGEGEEKAGFFIGGEDDDSGTVGTSQAKTVAAAAVITMTSTSTSTSTTTDSRSALDREDSEGGGSSGGDRGHDGVVGGTVAAEISVAGRRFSAPEPVQTYHHNRTSDDDIDDDDDNDVDADIPPRRRSLGDHTVQANGGGGTGRRRGVRVAPSPASLATSVVLKAAEGVVAGACSLAPLDPIVPGAREALGVVAGLARLAAADHRGDTKDMRKRVRWCQGVVLTLERARALLGKVNL